MCSILDILLYKNVTIRLYICWSSSTSIGLGRIGIYDHMHLGRIGMIMYVSSKKSVWWTSLVNFVCTPLAFG